MIGSFSGDAGHLRNAIGAYFLGWFLGWKVLYLVLDRRSCRHYERLLGVRFREVCPDVGRLAYRSMAWRNFAGKKNFWKAVKGETDGVRSAELGGVDCESPDSEESSGSQESSG